MPRIARVVRVGAVHHVIARFVDRSWLLSDDEERAAYLSRLVFALGRSDWTLLAYALMSNHVHLVLEAGQAPLQSWAKSTHSRMARWLNMRHRRLGPVFADRPYAEVVEPSGVPNVIAYVHNNPVRARVVSCAEESAWTSHSMYLGEAVTPRWLSVSRGLELCGYSTAQEDRDAFREWVRVCAAAATQAHAVDAKSEQATLCLARLAFGPSTILGTPTISDACKQYSVIVPSGATVRPADQDVTPQDVLRILQVTRAADPTGRDGYDHRPEITVARRVALATWASLGRRRIEMARALGISASSASNLVNRRPERIPSEQVREVLAAWDARLEKRPRPSLDGELG